ncbi:MAG: DNA polymerase/3'-5' exonuclease PolX [Candidatus Pacebacteria bacterium]|nr:DNA polymerase/3'-5' exonuclease PolX [Candidatus Paceibacterota bacterium]
MGNKGISDIFKEIAIYLEMSDDRFRSRAYENASEALLSLGGEVSEIYKNGGIKALEEIPGVGVSIAEKIEEVLKTGKLKYYEQFKKKIPVVISELMRVEGMGPKTIKILYQKLKVKNLTDLEKAARAGKIRNLEGFGIKSEENILKSLGFLGKSEKRILLGEILPVAKSVEIYLKKIKEVEKVMAAGSVRRRKETAGDIDFLAISKKPEIVMEKFVNLPGVERIVAHGNTKSAIKLESGLDMDLRVVPKESYGAALAYFTGSKEHNIVLREIAIKKGWKLNEYGLFKGAKQIAGATEEEIYEKLGMDYIEPELREVTGEIEAAQKHKLPKLIGYGDLKGDLHVHSNWTDGANSIEEMARAAMSLGHEYIVITDHTKRLAMTRGLDEKRIQQQWKEIDGLNKKLKSEGSKFVVLKGTECDILKDGSLDLPDNILSKLDIVSVSVHSLFNLSREDQTNRIKKAIENPNVNILNHPTGRIINKREAYQLDIDEIIKQAKKFGVAMQINAFPDRLDLKDEHIRKCVEAGVKMSIDTDSHSVNHLPFLEYGISQARRGWATKNDIINAWPAEKMLKMLN